MKTRTSPAKCCCGICFVDECGETIQIDDSQLPFTFSFPSSLATYTYNGGGIGTTLSPDSAGPDGPNVQVVPCCKLKTEFLPYDFTSQGTGSVVDAASLGSGSSRTSPDFNLSMGTTFAFSATAIGPGANILFNVTTMVPDTTAPAVRITTILNTPGNLSLDGTVSFSPPNVQGVSSYTITYTAVGPIVNGANTTGPVTETLTGETQFARCVPMQVRVFANAEDPSIPAFGTVTNSLTFSDPITDLPSPECATYGCVDGKCEEVVGGEYKTLEECEQNCEQGFLCNTASGICSGVDLADNPGAYPTEQECNDNCEANTGACCGTGGDCSVGSEADCNNAGGTFQGAGTTCDDPAIACTDRWKCNQLTGICDRVPSNTPDSYETEAECLAACSVKYHCSDDNGTPSCVPYEGELPPPDGRTLYDTHADCAANCQCCTKIELIEAQPPAITGPAAGGALIDNTLPGECYDQGTYSHNIGAISGASGFDHNSYTARVESFSDLTGLLTEPVAPNDIRAQGLFDAVFNLSMTVPAGCLEENSAAPISMSLVIEGVSTVTNQIETVLRMEFVYNVQCCESSYQGAAAPAAPMMMMAPQAGVGSRLKELFE